MQERCNHGVPNPSAGIVTTSTTVKIDTIKGNNSVSYVPVPYKVLVHDTISRTDTFEIAYAVKGDVYKFDTCNYATCKKFLYSDTLRLDSSGFVVVVDTVKGSIEKRTFSYSLFSKSVINNIVTKDPERAKLLFGVEYMYPSNYAGAAILLQLKNGSAFKGSFGSLYSKPQFGISYFTKIKLKK